MDLRVEEEDGRLLINSPDRQHTVLNFLKQTVWDAGGRAGYDKGHPYTGESTLVVNADDPQDALSDAVDEARDQLEEFRDAFENA